MPLSVACGVWRVACGVWRVACGVWRVAVRCAPALLVDVYCCAVYYVHIRYLLPGAVYHWLCTPAVRCVLVVTMLYVF